MERKDYIRKREYAHIQESERYQMEVLLAKKVPVGEIANLLERHVSTIYREKKRGTVLRVQSDLREKAVYRANVGQEGYIRRGRNKERSLKIGKDKKLEKYIRIKLIEERYSPDAIIGEIKARGLEFKGMVCTKTLYNYIDAGIFSGISNENLWQKRKRRRRGYRRVGRISKTNRLCRSIEKRPEKANRRREYGHWEGDTVKGPAGSTASILTLTERKSREEIIIRLEAASQEAIQEAFDRLEREYGPSFKVKFKSITLDNGPEFLNWKSLEVSVLDQGRRTTIYFAHSYSSWERGTNENHNLMIRRFIPKGTNITLLDERDIKEIEEWMNKYPRKILGYKTPRQVATECLQGNVFDRMVQNFRN